MLERVPTVLTAKEILDKAYRDLDRIQVQDPDTFHRVRKTEEARMKHMADTICDTLRRLHGAFPTLEQMPEYDREVLDILIGIGRVKQALGHVDWAVEKIRELHTTIVAGSRRGRDPETWKAARRRLMGRASSIVDDLDDHLTLLRETRDRAKLVPTVHPGMHTVVIAGFPNVGKSSLLAAWTRAKPEIADYAFTTKQANIGHFDAELAGEPVRIQLVDTPGLLDRPDEERNAVERQATAALRFAADAVLFLLDPSETSGYSTKEQERLLAEVQAAMAGVPMLVAETKADLFVSEGAKAGRRLAFSTKDGAGLPELRAAILGLLSEDTSLEEDPLQRWAELRREKGLD